MSLTFNSKKERKVLLGMILRKEKGVEEAARVCGCGTQEILDWLAEEGVQLDSEPKARLLTKRTNEELIREIYSLRSRLSAKEARLIAVTNEKDTYKRMYEQLRERSRRTL